MTCIIGYIHNKKVYIAGDSAGVAGYNISIRKDPKVFKNGKFIMGFTSSFRMGQLLMSSKFKIPRQKSNETDYNYMITSFVDAVIKVFKNGGFLKKQYDVAEGGTFLVGYKGKLYQIDSDFQVGEIEDDFNAIGCGHDIAKGAMYALKNNNELLIPEDRLKIALEAASRFSAGVAPPFNVVCL